MPLSAAKQIIEFLVLLRVSAKNSWLVLFLSDGLAVQIFYVGVGVASGISN